MGNLLIGYVIYKNKIKFSSFIEDTDIFITKTLKLNEWADEHHIKAASILLNRPIKLFSNAKSFPLTYVHNEDSKKNSPIHLGYKNSHYVCLLNTSL